MVKSRISTIKSPVRYHGQRVWTWVAFCGHCGRTRYAATFQNALWWLRHRELFEAG